MPYLFRFATQHFLFKLPGHQRGTQFENNLKVASDRRPETLSKKRQVFPCEFIDTTFRNVFRALSKIVS